MKYMRLKGFRIKEIIAKGFRGLDRIIQAILRLLPVKNNYMILESEGDYTDNIYTFYNYLIKNKYNEKYKLIWFVHDPQKYSKVHNVRFISRFHSGIHLNADYYIAVSKFFLFSHSPYWLKTWRKNQIVILTCHSASQLKSTPPVREKQADYILCSSEYVRDKIRKKIFVADNLRFPILGMPRVDLMFKHKDCIKLLFKDYAGQKIILSMETFKQSFAWSNSGKINKFAINVISSLAELKKLDDFLVQKNAIFIIKIHHLQDLSFLVMADLKNIRYLTDDELRDKGIQVNELLENADILLTDYSSAFYEYLMLDRPVGFLIGDMKQYDRGFIMEEPLNEMPGEKLKTVEDLIRFIENVFAGGTDRYRNERQTIRNNVFLYQDDKNCERLLKWMENL